MLDTQESHTALGREGENAARPLRSPAYPRVPHSSGERRNGARPPRSPAYQGLLSSARARVLLVCFCVSCGATEQDHDPSKPAHIPTKAHSGLPSNAWFGNDSEVLLNHIIYLLKPSQVIHQDNLCHVIRYIIHVKSKIPSFAALLSAKPILPFPGCILVSSTTIQPKENK